MTGRPERSAERVSRNSCLQPLLRLAAAEQCRIDADEAPRSDVPTPSARPEMTPPAVDAFVRRRAAEADRERRFADVVIAGYRQPRHGQTVLLLTSRRRYRPRRRPRRRIHRRYGRSSSGGWWPHLLHEHVPVVDEVGALPAHMRVRHLHDADGGLRPRKRRFTVMAWPGRRSEIAHLLAHAGQRLEAEAHGDQLQDRGRVVGGAVDVAALGERRDDQRGDARCRSPAVAPARARSAAARDPRSRRSRRR